MFYLLNSIQKCSQYQLVGLCYVFYVIMGSYVCYYYDSFGGKIVGSRTGITFNNAMDDASLPGEVNVYGIAASPANYLEPGKRPLSTSCGALLLDEQGRVVLGVGGSGATGILSAAAQVKKLLLM